MREIAEIRVNERFASLLFAGGEGECLGPVRRIMMDTTDPRFTEVGRLQNELRKTKGEPFFFGWSLKRQATASELRQAKLFLLHVSAVFEPAGEERGTKYDESTACPNCGAGGTQSGSLVLDLKSIPKKKDIAKTIAGEIIVSRRLVDALAKNGFTASSVKPVRMNVASSAESKDWFQLASSSTCEITPPTRIGNDPFDDDTEGEHRCPLGDLVGLNLTSAVTVIVKSVVYDFMFSRQFVGVRRGLLRPERLLLVAPRVWNLFQAEKVKGCVMEPAHLGEGSS